MRKDDDFILEVVDDEDSNDGLVAKSDAYYHKGIATVCPYRPYPPSELLDFDRFPITESKFPLGEPPKWCIYYQNRLTELIRKSENDV